MIDSSLLGLYGDVIGHGGPVGVTVDDLLRLAHRSAGDGDVETMVEQIPHVSANHQSGSEYNNFLHERVLSQRPS